MRSMRAALVGAVTVVVLVVSGPASAGASRDARSADAQKQNVTVVKAAGDIDAAIAEYQALLGPDNGGGPTSFPSGRREINWDAVPDELAQPNAYLAEFFNAKEAPRARGVVLATPGDALGVSADSDNPDGALPRFGDLNPTYVDEFTTHSAERLFSPVGSNVATIRFFVPGTDTKAAVRGFGAVYTGVDTKRAAEFEFADADGKVLGAYAVPKSKDGLSFLGVVFPKAVVASVKIVYGTSELGPDDTKRYDVAVMDDFIYGEPQAIKD